MKRAFLCSLMIFSLFWLGGWSNWKDAQQKYGNAISNSPTCGYSGNGSSGVGFKSINFKVNSNGILAQYDDNSYITIVDSKGTHDNHDIGGNLLYFYQKSFLDSFLSAYQSNNSCLSSVWACSNNAGTVFISEKKMSDYTCFQYSLNRNTSSNNNTSTPTGTMGINCYKQNATTCSQIQLKDPHNNTFYLERGRIKENGNSFQNYYVVAYGIDKENKILKDAVAATKSDDYLLTSTKGDVFHIKDEGVFASNELGRMNADKVYVSYDDATKKINIYSSEQSAKESGDILGTEIEQNKIDIPASELKPDPFAQSTPEKEYEIKDIPVCETPNILKVIQVVGYIIFVMKILVPLVLIIMGSKDFAGALISSNDKANNEALAKLVRRILIAVVIFFIPTILNYALLLVDGVTDLTGEFTNCTTCLLDPGNCKNAEVDWDS